MREILFRGKRMSDGKWVEGNAMIPNPRFGGETCIISHDAPYHSFCYEVDPETVGQFTGLTDSNGKKIFEGDIVAFESHGYIPSTDKGTVMFKDGCYGIEYRVWKDKFIFHRIGSVTHWQDMGASGTITYTYEVIGNIYDNPELLKEEK